MRVGPGAAAILLALALPPIVAAHVVITPPFVKDGEETLISLNIPNERPPHATIEIVTTAPSGVEIVSANAPPGWRASAQGNTATWRQGRITDGNVVAFPMLVLADVRAGTYVFRTEQRYDDGAIVRWTSDLAILPGTGAAAPDEHPWNAVAAAIIGLLVIGSSLVCVHLFRRRSLQE